jgi:hypothetical protein
VARSIALSKLREELRIERETRDIRKWSEGSLDLAIASCINTRLYAKNS